MQGSLQPLAALPGKGPGLCQAPSGWKQPDAAGHKKEAEQRPALLPTNGEPGLEQTVPERLFSGSPLPGRTFLGRTQSGERHHAILRRLYPGLCRLCSFQTRRSNRQLQQQVLPQQRARLQEHLPKPEFAQQGKVYGKFLQRPVCPAFCQYLGWQRLREQHQMWQRPFGLVQHPSLQKQHRMYLPGRFLERETAQRPGPWQELQTSLEQVYLEWLFLEQLCRKRLFGRLGVAPWQERPFAGQQIFPLRLVPGLLHPFGQGKRQQAWSLFSALQGLFWPARRCRAYGRKWWRRFFWSRRLYFSWRREFVYQ